MRSALRPAAGWSAQAAVVVGATLVAWSAAIHLHLWNVGYSSIPTIGPLFLGQAVGGFVLAVVMVALRSRLAALAGALYLAATVGGLLMSVWFGLFGFQDHLAAPYAGMSLVIESVGAVLLATTALVSRSTGTAEHR